MAKTIRDKLAEALIARGEREVPSRSGKFRTFTRSDAGAARIKVSSKDSAKFASGTFYFLGRSGALRFGHCASKSYPVSDRLKDALLGRAPYHVEKARRLRGADCGSRYGMPVAAGMLK